MPNPKSDSTKKPSVKAASQSTPVKETPASTPVVETVPDRQSQLATILIGLLIIASGLLLYNYFQNTSAPQTKTTADQSQPTPSSISTQQANSQATKPTPTPKVSPTPNVSPTPKAGQQPTSNQGSYTVQPGDSLWKIAQSVYGTGFDWAKIDQANHLNRDASGHPVLLAGQILTIPNSAATTQQPAASSATNQPGQQLAQTPATAVQTYTVQRGDTLWSIAQAFYGHGTDWRQIYQDPHNSLGTLPDGTPLIHAGNTLYIPQLK